MGLGRGDFTRLCGVSLPARTPSRPHPHRHAQPPPQHRDITVNTPERFVAALADTHLPSVFNPYSETCPVHDRADAAELRRRNLTRFLKAAIDARVDTMWIA